MRVAVGVLLALHVALSVVPAFSSFRSDFLNYYLPARACREGRSLDLAYDRLWMAAEAERAGQLFVGLFMPNPPPNALLLVPLAGLSAPAAKAVWTVVLLGALAGAYLVLRRLLPLDAGVLALVFLVPSTATANALGYGPPYALLVLLTALALAAALRGRDWACGVLLAPVVALKLYALVLLPYFLWTRRWRAAAGLAAGVAGIALVSVAALGFPIHAAYVREMLPASLDGRVIDPYSPYWQTLAAVSRRLFQFEGELNAAPVADLPWLAAALSRGAAAVLLAVSVLAARVRPPFQRQTREWAALLLASLAASPMTASYHLVLLVVPCAILMVEKGALRATAVLALLAFGASSLPHRFVPLAEGWGNLVAAPRLLALLALWAMAVAPLLSRRAIVLGVLAGVLAAATALAPAAPPPPGSRIAAARGLLLSEPLECGGRTHWVSSPDRTQYSVLSDDGGRVPGDTARCREGTLLAGRAEVARALGVEPTAAVVDVDRVGDVTVRADTRSGELREQVAGGEWRVLARGGVRYPRLDRGGRWLVYQAWAGASWDVRALERSSGRVVSVAAGRDNEIEPSWSEDGTRVLLASDHRRGLFGPALYSVPFRP